MARSARSGEVAVGMENTKRTARAERAPEEAPPRRAQRLGPEVDIAARLRTAQEALLSRPRISIRVRLVASLCLCFVIFCAFTLASLDVLHRTRAKLQLAQTIERLDDRIVLDQGVITAGHVDRVLDAAREAEALLRKVEPPAMRNEDRPALTTLVRQAEASRQALLASARDGHHAEGSGALPIVLAAQLRGAEAEAHRVLAAVGARERAEVDPILGLAEGGSLFLLGFMLLFFAAITFAFTRALGAPISRFKGYTSRIAGGDFAFIRPARRYRDEFSDLAVAVNQMLAELRAQQNRIVKGAKLAAVGTLTSGIAHELNNPLNNISITAEALMEGLSTLGDEEKWRHLQDIYFETERASEIVKSLLDFTRKEKQELVALDLGEVLGSTLRLAHNELAINDVTLETEIPKDLPRVLGVANQMRQVFLNLLINAVQAMPGGGKLTVSADAHDPAKVCVEIRDEGVGIAPDILPRIFDPFFTTKEPGKGTGLGLSVSLGIVRKFGGDIQVESEPGKGTTLHVCLPTAEER
jgi:two-component system, NtrC family, sensor kinase